MGCEGDIGSAMVAMVLQELGGRPVTMVEPFSIDESKNRILLGHPCVATCMTFVESVSSIHFRPVKPDEGVFVQFPVKPGLVTIANVSGRIGGILAGVQFNENARLLLNRLIQQEGIDHHSIVTFGDLKKNFWNYAIY